MSQNKYSILDWIPSSSSSTMEKSKWNPRTAIDETAPNCPRCAATNTKFCYYNNYSLSQPRYFCKSCRRYWTKGGSLRNVPVGGGSRKARRTRRQCKGEAQNGAVYDRGATSETEDGVVLGGSRSRVCDDIVLQAQGSSLEMDSDATLQYPPPLDLINGGDGLYEYVDGQDFVHHNYYCNGFGLEGIFDADVTSFQSTVDLQDLDLFSPDERFRLSDGLVDDWGPLDQSVYEMFTGL